MHETKYTSETSLGHRKDYGQYFTPSTVARLMAGWIMKDNPKTVLDPAFGLGVFFDEISKISECQHTKFTGYEIDKHILTFLNSHLNRSNLKIINGDYLEADVATFDGIICNPPYMRFQKFLSRHDVLPKIEEKIGKKLVGYSNIASVFLVKALKELSANGRLAFIIPFEFFNTGYGEEIKKSLLDGHLLKQIVTFSNEKDIFQDATTTVCILLCRNDSKEESVKITHIKSNVEIERISDISTFYQKQIKPSDLPYNKKWSPIILSLFSEQIMPKDFCKLSFYGSFKRGIATGANDFFSLNKSRIEELKLGENNLCKCITKSPQIKTAIFTEDDFNKLSKIDKAVYCLDVKDHDDASVVKYIKTGEQLGLNNRYLTKIRNPWYKIERRQAASILFGVFSRGRLKVIRNYSSAINFTCFHCFYPNLFGVEYINKLFVYFLSDTGQSIVKMNKRSYGSNLDKLEPGDLNDCLCPNQDQFDLIKESEAVTVIEVAKTNIKRSIQLSNELVDRIVNFKQVIKQDHCSAPLHRRRLVASGI
jgi:adenine-specific DNA-methyltransferase